MSAARSSDNQRGFRNQPRPESQRYAWPRGVDLLEPIEHEEYAGRRHIAALGQNLGRDIFR